MSYSFIAAISIFYLLLLFAAAFLSKYYTHLSEKLSKNGVIYALSLGIYCTAWTFYGSIGAATTGLGFMGVYLGPTLVMPLWLFILKKIIRISKYLRITSIADFISSRYGKSAKLGVVTSLLCFIVVIPYISIQLKALAFSVNILHGGVGESSASIQSTVFYQDPSLLFALTFMLFAILFGTRKLDPSEKHPEVVNVMAFESVIKLLFFGIGALAIVYGVFDGVEDICDQAYAKLDIQSLAYIGGEGTDYSTWLWILILSAFAFLLLPRQFHMAVVENNSFEHVYKATWITPLYLFLISIFVLPIAFAGRLLFGSSIEPDTYLLSIPIHEGYQLVAVVVFLGGLAAVSGMIIISVLSLSIMISNNIFLPLLLRIEKRFEVFNVDLNKRILQLRRVLIIMVILFSYGFYNLYSINYSIVSVGLISFAGIAQLAPCLLFGLYWKESNARGAMAGLLVGISIWAFTLPYANLAELGIVDVSLLTNGIFGWHWANPHALFGLTGMSPIAHGAFWSLTANTLVHILVSMHSERSILEITQSDIFINPEKYYKSNKSRTTVLERSADIKDIKAVLTAILGSEKLKQILGTYYSANGIIAEPKIADSNLINYIERHLSGSIGTASANIVLKNIVDQNPIETEELLALLDQTYQIFEYSQLLEAKSKELTDKSDQLAEANKRLTELDSMKSEFISNVTHELRTPITAIRSLASTLVNYDVTQAERRKFLNIIQEESDRISHLINQVLDLRKIEVIRDIDYTEFNLKPLVEGILRSLHDIKGDRTITLGSENFKMYSDSGKVKQILLNLVSNAIKFTDASTGEISIKWHKNEIGATVITIADNGFGIKEEDLTRIFERFYQVHNGIEAKTKGSGLGLSICQSLATALGGRIEVKSSVGNGSTFYVTL